MKAASGETEEGGDRSPLWPATEEWTSLDTLGDLVVRGEGYPESNRDVGEATTSEGAIARLSQRKKRPQRRMRYLNVSCVYSDPASLGGEGDVERTVRTEVGGLNEGLDWIGSVGGRATLVCIR